MSSIPANLQAVYERIARAAALHGRATGSVTLLAVSKTFDATAVAVCADAGQCAFGENYVQEALDKVAALHARGLEWHFIGPIQSNKTRAIAEHFDWVHGIEREKIARRLSDARPAALAPLQVCIQVNVSGEASKSGVAPGEVAALAASVGALPRVKLRGLMAIPEPTPDSAARRARFRMLCELKADLIKRGHDLDTLSMGMSDDLEDAIAEGATLVRVGSAIFGKRAAGPAR